MMSAIDPKLRVDLGIGFALKAFGAIASFALSWLIARQFGASSLGLFQLALVSAGLASIIALSGFDIVLIRELGGAISDRTKGVAAQLYGRSLRNILIFAVCLFAGLVLAAPFLTQTLGAEPELTTFIYVLSPLVLVLPVIRLSCALLRTGRRVLLSQSLDGVAYTGFTALCLLALVAFGGPNDAFTPAYLYAGGVVLVGLLAISASRQLIGGFAGFRSPTPAQFAGVVVAAPYLLATANEWLLLSLVTFFEGAASTGIYRVSFQIAGLIMLINSSFATMTSPWLSKAASDGRFREVATLTHKVGLVGIGLALPFAALVIWKPDFVLALFGEEFTQGAAALQLLIVAQLIHLGFGPLGAALIMIGKHRVALSIEIFATLMGICIGAYAISRLGIVGAAMGILTIAILRNVVSTILLQKFVRANEAAHA
ncbi:MATE family efflux transporter [Altererythrobacter lutimaris]|uniref:Oligosaccharide flippase family protein n=1 Tax=Altererythrobacter lutimaris TaxID=2743979 RepID=A0A850H8U3_9SPHN|nr:MATE family efflux transporter [Altererythrobacter lutimaris]NVE95724.1 hypothetical protein [Altererythrobacter lutimaris]